MKRTVAVLLRRAPYGRVHVAEGLRAASGVAAGFDNHDVAVCFVEDAVHATRGSADWDALDMTPHLEALFEADANLMVDETAISERGLEPDDIASDFDVRDSAAIDRIIRDADRQMTY